MSEVFDVEGKAQTTALRNSLQDKINKATALSFTTSTEGWQILLDTFEDMKDAQNDIMYGQRPGNNEAILASHAVWYSVCKTIDNIVTAIGAAIEEGQNAKVELAHLNEQTPDEEDWS